jgi:hypothetical protein
MRGSSTVEAARSAGLEEEDADLEESSHSSAWQAGSLPDRLAGISTLAKHADLQAYLAGLEGDVLEGDDVDDGGSQGGGNDEAAAGAAAAE